MYFKMIEEFLLAFKFVFVLLCSLFVVSCADETKTAPKYDRCYHVTSCWLENDYLVHCERCEGFICEDVTVSLNTGRVSPC